MRTPRNISWLRRLQHFVVGWYFARVAQELQYRRSLSFRPVWLMVLLMLVGLAGCAAVSLFMAQIGHGALRVTFEHRDTLFAPEIRTFLLLLFVVFPPIGWTLWTSKALFSMSVDALFERGRDGIV